MERKIDLIGCWLIFTVEDVAIDDPKAAVSGCLDDDCVYPKGWAIVAADAGQKCSPKESP